MRIPLKKALLLLTAGLIASCSKNNVIYSPSHDPITDEVISNIEDSNPIIVVPGIGGTRLVDASNGKAAWGSYGFTSYWPSTAKENELLALPWTSDEADAKAENNTIKPLSVLEKVSINLLPFSSIDLAIYSTIVRSLENAGYIRIKDWSLKKPNRDSPKPPLFEFAYDWRKSNADNAKELEKFVDEKTKQLKAENSTYGDKKFNIVCHSMGCLVSRYFLRYGEQGLGTSTNPPELDWRGSKRVENIIMVAPPNKGSIEALNNLVHGFHPHHIALIKYPAAVLGTMPSMYELLPTEDIANATNQNGEKIDLLNPELWQSMNWGLLDPKQKKILNQISSEITTKKNTLQEAQLLQAKLLGQAKLFHSRMDIKKTPPEGLGFYLFAGVGKPTESGVLVNTETKSWSVKSSDAGDGTVLKVSAFALQNADDPEEGLIIPWNNAIFFFSTHMDLVQNNDLFANLYDILTWRYSL